MKPKLHLNLLIKAQKIAARKAIAQYENSLHEKTGEDKLKTIKAIKEERDFLNTDFDNIDNIRDLIKKIHKLRHNNISKNSDYSNCAKCRNVLADASLALPEKDKDLRPRFGNLIAVLEQEVADEKATIERKRLPTQNDLLRWALKDAVLSYYQGLNFPENFVVVDVLYDDRLTTRLAPDFDVIAEIWMTKLDELKRRKDKYALNPDEYDEADQDLSDGMRGSAFEKRLDRYREEFMKKLMR